MLSHSMSKKNILEKMFSELQSNYLYLVKHRYDRKIVVSSLSLIDAHSVGVTLIGHAQKLPFYLPYMVLVIRLRNEVLEKA